jgi:hypothetical protein
MKALSDLTVAEFAYPANLAPGAALTLPASGFCPDVSRPVIGSGGSRGPRFFLLAGPVRTDVFASNKSFAGRPASRAA